MQKLTVFLLLILSVSGCESPGADVVFTGGAIYRVTETESWATAVAVTGKKISYVGNDEGAAAFIGPNTRVVELHGKMMLPGFQDAHVHPVDSGMTFN